VENSDCTIGFYSYVYNELVESHTGHVNVPMLLYLLLINEAVNIETVASMRGSLMNMEQLVWSELTGETEVLKENLPQYHFFFLTNPTWLVSITIKIDYNNSHI
jgi:hypothetical protein